MAGNGGIWPPPAASAALTVDLGALRRNYRALKGVAGTAECAGVVKADGYGLGAEYVTGALAAEGCTTFFVATLGEARQVRAVAPQAAIYVLDGLFPGTAAQFADMGLRPILASVEEVAEWAAFCRAAGRRFPAAVQIDTGMNRLGLDLVQTEALASAPEMLEAFELSLVMSHLACADDPAHPKNPAQRELFEAMRKKLPPAPASLAASAGTQLGPAYHYDMVRPGVALYGGGSIRGGMRMEPVVTVIGRIAMVREAQPGETVGYGATRTLTRPTRIAVVTLGYADGYFRLLSTSDTHEGARGYIADYPAPLLGRVSMDLIAVDVTEVPPELAQRGRWVELLGTHVTVDEMAEWAQTIGYEVLTNLGHRFERRYVDM